MVLITIGGRPRRLQREHCAKNESGTLCAECLQCESLCAVLVMSSGEHFRQPGNTRCVGARAMSEQCVYVGLVEYSPVLDTITKPFCHNASILSKFLDDIPIEPAALILQSLRQIPMIEAQPRRYPARDQPVN